MKVHLLRPASITPIARYLERQQSAPRSFDVQLGFAAVLLYREGEYRAMYSSRWRRGNEPAPDPESPFCPFDITPEAAAGLARVLHGTAALTGPLDANDLFGLKDTAISGLAGALRHVKSHRLGWLVHARLLLDVCRFTDAIADAERAAELGEPLHGFALAYRAALLGSSTGEIPDGGEAADRFAARARRHATSKLPHGPRWADRAMAALDKRVRQLGVRTRSREEGEAFTRFITTEIGFCESERDAALASFDAERVPPELRPLVALARRLGVGDDACRALFVSKMSAAERRAAAAQIREHATAIDAWLSSLGGPPYIDEAAAFFWLLAVADELSG